MIDNRYERDIEECFNNECQGVEVNFVLSGVDLLVIGNFVSEIEFDLLIEFKFEDLMSKESGNLIFGIIC